jgi:hypothetical protein
LVANIIQTVEEVKLVETVTGKRNQAADPISCKNLEDKNPAPVTVQSVKSEPNANPKKQNTGIFKFYISRDCSDTEKN